MNESQLWALFWKCCTAVIAVACLTVGGCVTKQNMIVEEMVKAGADPIAASCAINANSVAAMCIISASKPKTAQP